MAKVIKLKNNTYLYGTIIEKGSNANGEYIKYSDGTLIQYNNFTDSDFPINNAYGSLYQGSKSFNFPISFVGTPKYVGCSRCRWGTGASWGNVSGYNTTEISIRAVDVASRPSGTTVYISWLAIGRWK